MAATLASFSRMTWVPSCFSMTSRTGKFVQSARLGERMTMPVAMSMKPGTPMPMPQSVPASLYLVRTCSMAAHMSLNDEVASALDLGAERQLLEQLAGVVDCGDAQIGSTQIHADGECLHCSAAETVPLVGISLRRGRRTAVCVVPGTRS